MVYVTRDRDTNIEANTVTELKGSVADEAIPVDLDLEVRYNRLRCEARLSFTWLQPLSPYCQILLSYPFYHHLPLHPQCFPHACACDHQSA